MNTKDKYTEKFKSLFDKWNVEFDKLEGKITKAGANPEDLDEPIKSARADFKDCLNLARKDYCGFEKQILDKDRVSNMLKIVSW